MKANRTFSPKPGQLESRWLLFDAAGLPLGRLASELAVRLRGKHKPTFAPHIDGGDFVIVVNARLIEVTSGKSQSKIYYRHSGYPGGLRAESFEHLRDRHPERLIEQAVRGMLPKNRLGRHMIRKLKVYAGPDHPHQAQQPELVVLETRKVDV
jgi:large subunit ribosomal protein L13